MKKILRSGGVEGRYKNEMLDFYIKKKAPPLFAS